MPVTANTAGSKLAEYLKRVNMQQKELARLLDIEPSYISRMVRGHINWTTGQYFGRIASSLNLSNDEIKELNTAAVVEIKTENPKSSLDIRDAHITDELKEAIKIYSEIDPLIGSNKIQVALSTSGRFEGGPITPHEWIKYFNDIRNWLDRIEELS